MKRSEIEQFTGRSEKWLRNHECAWCGQTLWLALRNGCGAIIDRCDPTHKDFTKAGKVAVSSGQVCEIARPYQLSWSKITEVRKYSLLKSLGASMQCGRSGKKGRKFYWTQPMR